jgi:hypothetical protein
VKSRTTNRLAKGAAVLGLVAIACIWLLLRTGDSRLAASDARRQATGGPIAEAQQPIARQSSNVVLAQVDQARGQASILNVDVAAGNAAAGAAAPPGPLPPGRRPRSTPPPDLQDAVDKLTPLLKECFKLGQQERSDLREAKVMVTLQITGNGSRGVIEKSSVDEGSRNLTPVFAECVRETMYRLELSAPQGERVGVVYPLRFAAPGATPAAVSASADER